jgi:hypothetical protein
VGQRCLFACGLLLLALLLPACNNAGGAPNGQGSQPTQVGTTPPAQPLLTPGLQASPTPTSTPTAISVGSPEPTDTAAACTFPATSTTEAWICDGQVLASIGGDPATTLSDFSYPLLIPNGPSLGSTSPNALFWSPDGAHLAVEFAPGQQGGVNCYPFILDVQTQAITRVALPSYPTQASAPTATHLAWADAQTLLIFGAAPSVSGVSVPPGLHGSAGTTTYRYNLSSGQASPLPGVTAAASGVVRGSVLFYLELTPLSQIAGAPGFYQGTALLHRYDLTSQQEIGTPLALGDTLTSAAASSLLIPGWDASPAGSQIVYQQTSVTFLAGALSPTITSRFWTARADGSNPTPILAGVSSSSAARLSISPDGVWVAATGIQPGPGTYADRLSGGAQRAFTPASASAPAWLADSSGFDASSNFSDGADVLRYLLSTPGALASGTDVIQNARNPATLP